MVPKLTHHLYIHQHVYDNELLTPKRVKDQLDVLIHTVKSSVINRKFIADHSDDQARVYDAIIQLLQDHDRDTKVGRKNWGEIVSLAAAKAMGIPVMLSDEGNLQQIVDEYLNSGTTDSLPRAISQSFGLKSLYVLCVIMAEAANPLYTSG